MSRFRQRSARCAAREDSWGKHLISERDYEKARDDAVAARVNHKHAIQTAQLQKESLQFELSARRLERDRQRLVVQDFERRVGELEIKSPVDGIVGTLAVTERASVPQSAAIITVVDLSALRDRIPGAGELCGRPEGWAWTRKSATVQRSTPARSARCRPKCKQSQVTGRVRFSDDVPPGLRQNQRAVDAHRARDRATTCSRSSAVRSSTAAAARRVRRAGRRRAQAHPIQTGATSVSAKSRSSQGLAPGDQIVISGTRRVRTDVANAVRAHRLTTRSDNTRDASCSTCRTSARSTAPS